MRTALVLGSVALAVAGAALAAAPAQADTGTTLVTFTTGTPGLLTILPAATAVGTASGSTITATLATVITDARATNAGWSDSVSSTAFNLVGATSPTATETIPASSAKIWTTSAVVTVPGTATPNTLSHTTSTNALVLSGTATPLVSATASNVNTVTLANTLQIDASGKDAGLYSGTLTQTVS